ncbi:hypothetical protein NSS70_20475 [Aeribacillus sp. FSL K6-2848]|uniref:hypothetical protein n=1 Tax=Aeribacillus sp. FSL K6-2848 TaxID=2954612 RepID=UPI0030F99B87
MAEMRESNKLGGLKVKVDVDVSDGLKGLKALRREANKALQILEKIEQKHREFFGDKKITTIRILGYVKLKGKISTKLKKDVRDFVEKYFLDTPERPKSLDTSTFLEGGENLLIRS